MSKVNNVFLTTLPFKYSDYFKENIKQKMNKFADYFVICGLDFNSGLEPDKYGGEFKTMIKFFYTRKHHILCYRGPYARLAIRKIV